MIFKGQLPFSTRTGRASGLLFEQGRKRLFKRSEMDNPKQWQKHRFEENVKDWKKQRQQRVDMFVKDIIDIIQQKDEEWCGLEQGWLDALKEVVGSERAEEVAAKLEDARILDIGEQIAKYFSPTQRADSPPLSPLQRDGINDFLNSSPILGHETITALPNNDTTSDRTLSIVSHCYISHMTRSYSNNDHRRSQSPLASLISTQVQVSALPRS